MKIMDEIDLNIQKLQFLEKDKAPLYVQGGEFRRLKDKENERKIWAQIREINNEICKLNLEIGRAYEKQALSLNHEERLSIFLRAFEYYKLSSCKESIRILTEARELSTKLNNSNLINLCTAQIIYIECQELDDKAEKLWYSIIRSEIKEQDDKCIQLSIQRDRIIKKLKDGLPYAQESSSSELVIAYYAFLSWSLYRRCDRSKFIDEIKSYHRKAAVILECLAWKSYPVNKENSLKYLRQALFQYEQVYYDSDNDRITEILVNAFEVTDYEYFIFKLNNAKTIEDIENLDTMVNERTFDKKESIVSFVKLRKAGAYAKLATENIDDINSFFIAAQYFEESHKDYHKYSEMGADMGNSLFLKSRGNLRIAINNGLLTTKGKKNLNVAIEQVRKSIDVSDWAFKEPVYLSIYETISNFINLPMNELNHNKIEEILYNVKFMIGQENIQKEKTILIYMEKLLESIIYDDKISILNCIKNIDNTIESNNEREIDLERFSKMQLNKQPFIEKWDKCKNESDKHKKGKLLEQFTVNLFSTIKGFTPVGSNLHTTNEEFDALFRNNIDRPFLQALNSPLIIFECKNWSKKVDIREVKAFSADLFDHNNLVKVGIFIAMNGFEAGCAVQQIRLSGSDKILILVTGEEIEKFLKSTKDTLEWLEDLISSGFN